MFDHCSSLCMRGLIRKVSKRILGKKDAKKLTQIFCFFRFGTKMQCYCQGNYLPIYNGEKAFLNETLK